MDHNKIDSLFREKLDGFEVTPSASAWSELEGKIGSRKKLPVYWVAASIALLLLAGITVLEITKPTNDALALGIIDHPTLENEQAFPSPVPVKIKTELTTTSSTKKKTKSLPNLLMTQVSPKKKKADDLVNIPEKESTAEMAMLNQNPSEEKTDGSPSTTIVNEKAKTYQVKITYIASNQNKAMMTKSKADSVSKIKKVIAFAEKIDPGQMLATFKMTKDYLLAGGLKNREDKTIMNP